MSIRRLSSGLRLRLCFEFGLIALGFSFFSGTVFLNAERAILQVDRERQVHERVAMIFAQRPPEEYTEQALLAGIRDVTWRSSTSAPWQGEPFAWQGEDDALHVVSTRRWYGRSPLRMQVAGVNEGLEWRAQVDMSSTAEILDSTARLISFYLLLNALLLVLIGVAWLTRLVIRPVTHLSNTISSVRRAGDFRELPVTRFDELGALTRSFNDLMARIRAGEVENARAVQKLEQAYQELSDVQDQLVNSEKLASLGRLSAGVAHEIGNPLSAIAGYLKLLPQLKGAEADEALENASRETARIDAIIRSLLAFARTDDHGNEPVDPVPFMNELVSRLESQPRFENITFQVDISADPATIDVASGRLEQVLVNLCINAADAMGGEGQIYLQAFAVQDRAIILVRDTGPGIPQEELPYVFDPFFTTKPAGEGTGLGLAISHQIISAVGGRIFVDNHRQGGAVFRLELPCVHHEATKPPLA